MCEMHPCEQFCGFMNPHDKNISTPRVFFFPNYNPASLVADTTYKKTCTGGGVLILPFFFNVLHYHVCTSTKFAGCTCDECKFLHDLYV